MLGTLARLFRVMGFDTAYAPPSDADDDLVMQAATQRRVLITRDYELGRRAQAAGVESVLVRNLPIEQQLTIVLTHLGAAPDPTHFFTRCTVCNGALKPVDAAAVHDLVPEGVRLRHTHFTRCVDCGKVYWPGTHVADMERRLADLVEALGGAPSAHG